MIDPTADTDAQPTFDLQSHAQYALRDRLEIAEILRTLARRNILVTAFRDDGSSFQTIVLAISTANEALLIDVGPSADGAEPHKLVCVTRLDKVKVQFCLTPLHAVTHAGRPALSAPIPPQLLRLQRREFFRVATPVTAPLTCTITPPPKDGREQSVPVRILDLSAGGLAIVVPPDGIAFEPGDEFDRCAIQIPNDAPLQVRLKVRNLFAVNTHGNVLMRRAGCEFIGLSNAASARIQRYLFKLERNRRDYQPE